MTRVALIQLNLTRETTDPSDTERTLRPSTSALAMIASAASAGSEMIMLPELWRSGAFELESTLATAELVPDQGTDLTTMVNTDPSGTAAVLAKAAAEHGIWLHGGSVLESSASQVFNTSMLFDPHGTLVAKYRKRHLFGFDSGEAALLSSGADLIIVDTPLGLTGLATCYDLRFPEHFRALVDAGVQSLLITSGWPLARAAHWRVLTQARAIENQCLLLACNGSGDTGEVTLAGQSVVIDAWGMPLAEMTESAGMILVDVDASQTAQTRATFPVLRDRIRH